tara:strand:+ start:421 stop:561 length:141 start_codon:yes stop_codon:yes gene_type:complete
MKKLSAFNCLEGFNNGSNLMQERIMEASHKAKPANFKNLSRLISKN